MIHKTKIMQKYPAQPHSLEISFLNVISIANVLLAITSLVVTSGGFKVSADVREAFDLLDWFISAFFIVEYYIRWWIAGFKLSYLKTNGHDFALIFLFFLLPLPFLKYSQNPFIAHNIDETVMAKLYIIGNLVSGRAKDLFGNYNIAFTVTLVLAVIGLVLAIIMLKMPKQAPKTTDSK